MSSNDGSEHWNEENEIVHTCGLCEMICTPNEVQSHPCLESFANYYLDKQTYYFYPQCEDGKILRRSLVDGTEQNVLEALVREDAEENIQEGEMTDEEGYDIENLPENENLRKIFIEERLIEAIRRRPPLWNFRLPITERGVRSKEKLWMDVIAVMKGVVTLADAKKKWKTLSDTFRRHRKNAELPSGSAAQKISKWIHFERMSFLRDVSLQNNTTSNIPEQDDTSADADCTSDSVDDSASSGRISRTMNKSTKKDNFMDEVRELIQEPINIDIQQNVSCPSIGFCTTVAYKLDVLSEDARDRAMMRILEVLREERYRDQV